MAKKKVNKSQKIRDMFAEMGSDARGRDVVEALKKKKIVVSPAQVSNIKQSLGKKSGRKSDRLNFDILLDAKKLVDKSGGVENAKKALETLAKLQ